MTLQTSTIIWLVLIVLVGVGVWITASQTLAIIWGVLILAAALTITGVTSKILGK